MLNSWQQQYRAQTRLLLYKCRSNPVPFSPARSQGNIGCLKAHGVPPGDCWMEGGKEIRTLIRFWTAVTLGYNTVTYPVRWTAAPVAPEEPTPGTGVKQSKIKKSHKHKTSSKQDCGISCQSRDFWLLENWQEEVYFHIGDSNMGYSAKGHLRSQEVN